MPFSGAAGLAAAQKQYGTQQYIPYGAQQYNPSQYMAYGAYGAGAYGAYQVGQVCIERGTSHVCLGMKRRGLCPRLTGTLTQTCTRRGGETGRTVLKGTCLLCLPHCMHCFLSTYPALTLNNLPIYKAVAAAYNCDQYIDLTSSYTICSLALPPTLQVGGGSYPGSAYRVQAGYTTAPSGLPTGVAGGVAQHSQQVCSRMCVPHPQVWCAAFKCCYLVPVAECWWWWVHSNEPLT